MEGQRDRGLNSASSHRPSVSYPVNISYAELPSHHPFFHISQQLSVYMRWSGHNYIMVISKQSILLRGWVVGQAVHHLSKVLRPCKALWGVGIGYRVIWLMMYSLHCATGSRFPLVWPCRFRGRRWHCVATHCVRSWCRRGRSTLGEIWPEILLPVWNDGEGAILSVA